MSTKDKLEIILITYNRENHLRKTLEQMYAENSPIKDYDVLILDNNSTDGTKLVVEEYQKEWSNLKYRKNKYNVGLSGNIAKAMETAEKEYLWILADDDKLDFSNWAEVENAIEQSEELIFLSRYVLPDEYINDPDRWLLQASLISACIVKTSLYDDTMMKNVFDNIYTLFPHLCPIVKFINDGKKPYIVDKYVVDVGASHNLSSKDDSYIRGTVEDDIYPRVRTMCWLVGYTNVVAILKNEKIKHKTLRTAINMPFIYGSEKDFVLAFSAMYFNKKLFFQFIDVFLQVDEDLQNGMLENCDLVSFLNSDEKYSSLKYSFDRLMCNISFGNLKKRYRLLKYRQKMLKQKKEG